jgi:hypothetical protein
VTVTGMDGSTVFTALPPQEIKPAISEKYTIM